MKGVHSFGVAAEPIESAAQVELTLGPILALIQGLLVECSGLGWIRVQGSLSAAREVIEIVSSLSGCQACQQQTSQENLHALRGLLSIA